jgi:hypothetical protein
MSNSNLYPFLTRAQVQERLTDPTFRHTAMVMLFQKQTEHEQATSTTVLKNRVGFMSSHAVHGTRIAKALLAGETLSDEDEGRVCSIAPRYSRQIALFMRQDAIVANPELKAVAGIFSADQA